MSAPTEASTIAAPTNDADVLVLTRAPHEDGLSDGIYLIVTHTAGGPILTDYALIVQDDEARLIDANGKDLGHETAAFMKDAIDLGTYVPVYMQDLNGRRVRFMGKD